MYFQTIHTGDFFESFLSKARQNPLPKGSKLIDINLSFDAGVPIIKMTFMNWTKEVTEKYAKQLKETNIIHLRPDFRDENEIKAEEISEEPELKSAPNKGE